MNYILFDGSCRQNFLPFTYTRPMAAMRMGILTAQERWEKWLGQKTGVHTVPYLQKKFPLLPSPASLPSSRGDFLLNASVFPDENLLQRLKKLQPGDALVKVQDGLVIAICLTDERITEPDEAVNCRRVNYAGEVLVIRHLWDLFLENGAAVERDYALLTSGKKSQPLSRTNRVRGKKGIFLEKGAKVEFAVLNVEAGPVYIGKDAEVMEGALLRGPLALCEGAQVKMGARIYGPTTIGPWSKAGGEVNNCIFFGYSNKAHDGFLGNSVIGEWCNIGAGTNNSNLKNNYGEVRVWNYISEEFEPTGQQFCGLFMGDHSKCAIHTMFNTGTVAGVCANIFGAGFPRKIIPSFSWGGAQGFRTHRLEEALETARKMMARRGLTLSAEEEGILKHIFEEAIGK